MGRCSEKCVVNSTNRDSKLYFCVQILVQTGFEKTIVASKYTDIRFHLANFMGCSRFACCGVQRAAAMSSSVLINDAR